MGISIEDIYKRIEILHFTLWENRAFKHNILEWLDNFQCEDDRNYALFILSRMMYFSAANIRNLLRALYRDKFRYPLIKAIRQKNNNTLDENIIESLFFEELKNTRFLGVGNPSESGVHLLYYFRQENNIPKDLFVNTDDIVYYDTDGMAKIREKYSHVKRFIFIDDICGSGTQATSDDSNVRRCVSNLRSLVPQANISYLMLFGLSKGIEVVRDSGLYDYSDAVIELDNSYACFSDCSRYFNNIENFDKQYAKNMAYKHGYQLAYHLAKKEGYNTPILEQIAQRRALGFGNCQLLLSLHHNTPDNTLPIIWFDEDETIWTPIFKRYNKNYTNI